MSRALQQRRDALQVANRRRRAIADVKQVLHELKCHEAMALAADVLLAKTAPIESSIRVRHLLEAIPFIGPSKSYLLLAHAGIVDGDLRIRELPQRQRQYLAEALMDPRIVFPHARPGRRAA